MWSQADHNEITLQPMDEYGWKITNSVLTIDWDSEQNMEAVRQRVSHVLSGCKCRVSSCDNRCSCRRKNKSCSEGCECINCTNIEKPTPSADSSELNDLAIEEIIETQMTDDLKEQIDEIMEQVFGATTTDCDELSDDSDDDVM